MNEAQKKALGRRISKGIGKTGMSQKEFADRLSLTPAAVSRYVSGQRVPRSETLAKIADFLGTDSEYLLGSKRTPSPSLESELRRAVEDMSDEEKLRLVEIIVKSDIR